MTEGDSNPRVEGASTPPPTTAIAPRGGIGEFPARTFVAARRSFAPSSGFASPPLPDTPLSLSSSSTLHADLHVPAPTRLPTLSTRLPALRTRRPAASAIFYDGADDGPHDDTSLHFPTKK
ncbi:hypothetical protein ACHAWF_016447 [Thalassiosira exigua]